MGPVSGVAREGANKAAETSVAVADDTSAQLVITEPVITGPLIAESLRATETARAPLAEPLPAPVVAAPITEQEPAAKVLSAPESSPVANPEPSLESAPSAQSLENAPSAETLLATALPSIAEPAHIDEPAPPEKAEEPAPAPVAGSVRILPPAANAKIAARVSWESETPAGGRPEVPRAVMTPSVVHLETAPRVSCIAAINSASAPWRSRAGRLEIRDFARAEPALQLNASLAPPRVERAVQPANVAVSATAPGTPSVLWTESPANFRETEVQIGAIAILDLPTTGFETSNIDTASLVQAEESAADTALEPIATPVVEPATSRAAADQISVSEAEPERPVAVDTTASAEATSPQATSTQAPSQQASPTENAASSQEITAAPAAESFTAMEAGPKFENVSEDGAESVREESPVTNASIPDEAVLEQQNPFEPPPFASLPLATGPIATPPMESSGAGTAFPMEAASNQDETPVEFADQPPAADFTESPTDLQEIAPEAQGASSDSAHTFATGPALDLVEDLAAEDLAQDATHDVAALVTSVHENYAQANSEGMAEVPYEPGSQAPIDAAQESTPEPETRINVSEDVRANVPEDVVASVQEDVPAGVLESVVPHESEAASEPEQGLESVPDALPAPQAIAGPDPARGTKPLEIVIAGIPPGKAKALQIFTSTLKTDVAGLMPHYETLPLRATMVLGPAEAPAAKIEPSKPALQPQSVKPAQGNGPKAQDVVKEPAPKPAVKWPATRAQANSGPAKEPAAKEVGAKEVAAKAGAAKDVAAAEAGTKENATKSNAAKESAAKVPATPPASPEARPVANVKASVPPKVEVPPARTAPIAPQAIPRSTVPIAKPMGASPGQPGSERELAEVNREQAKLNREQAELNRAQAELNREQARRNRELAKTAEKVAASTPGGTAPGQKGAFTSLSLSGGTAPAEETDLGLPVLDLEALKGRFPLWAKITAAAACVLLLAGGIWLYAKHVRAKTPEILVLSSAAGGAGPEWLENFSPDAKHPRTISVLRASEKWSDYSVEFNASVDVKALGWVFRAKDPANFYVARIEQEKTLAGMTAAFVYFPVLNGVPQPAKRSNVALPAEPGTVYRIRFDVFGDQFTAWIQDRKVEEWTDSSLRSGGAGLYSESGERALLQGPFRVIPRTPAR